MDEEKDIANFDIKNFNVESSFAKFQDSCSDKELQINLIHILMRLSKIHQLIINNEHSIIVNNIKFKINIDDELIVKLFSNLK